MKKKSFIPLTKVKNPEPNKKDDNWVIWAAWADRITFEEIKDKTGKKGKDLFLPLREAFTGMSHGPEMKKLIQLLGRDKILERVKI